jgi:IS5 family transposase
MVLQALEGLSDRDAARALRDRISWKVACGLALDDEGFDHSVLTYWRTRLRKSEHPERIFDAVRSVIDATGVLKGKTEGPSTRPCSTTPWPPRTPSPS